MNLVKINAINVPPHAGAELEKRFVAQANALDGVPGFLGFQLLRPTAGEDRYYVVTHWVDEDSFQNWRTSGSAHAAHAGEQRNPVSSGASLLEFEVVLDVKV